MEVNVYLVSRKTSTRYKLLLGAGACPHLVRHPGYIWDKCRRSVEASLKSHYVCHRAIWRRMRQNFLRLYRRKIHGREGTAL